MNELQDRLKSIMKTKDLTAKDLGNLTGIGYRTIEGWLSAKRIMPRADSAASVAQALGVTVEYLVFGINRKEEGMSDLRLEFHQWIDELNDDELEDLDTYLNLLEAGAIVTSLRSKKTGD